SFHVMLEPKVRGWAWVGTPTISKAEDDKGHALATTQPAEGHGTRYGNDAAVVAEFLDYPHNVPQRIAHLAGSIPIDLADQAATVTFHNLLAHGKQERSLDVGPNRLILKGFVSDSNGVRADLLLKRGPKESEEHWTIAAEPFGRFDVRAALVSPKGTSKQTGGSASWNKDEGHTELYFAPHEPSDQPTDLKVILPASFAPVTAKFEFKDLPMP